MATRVAASTSMADVQTEIDAADPGDIVQIPAGSATWGASAAWLDVDKAIIVEGAGQGSTTITLADDGGTYTNGTIRISAAATVKSMTINGSDANPVSAFSVSTVNDWMITDIEYVGGSSAAYFAYVHQVYGVIYSNDITSGHGSTELIFTRGPTDSWTTDHSIGGANNVFIESNVFRGPGTLCDINSNGRAVVRYNTITGTMKIDGHGKASNTPARGVRHMEVYNNTWTNTSNFWTALELRGGTGRVFDNVIESASSIWAYLTDYGYTSNAWPNFGNTCQCPGDYPVDDQIGVGKDPKVAASEPMYLWGNTKNGASLSLTWKSTAACTGECGAFDMEDVIQADTDYFLSDAKPGAMSGYTPYTYPHPLRNEDPLEDAGGMMRYLRQSTEQTVKIGPFMAEADGITGDTDNTIEDEHVLLSKNGGAFTAKAETTNCTHDTKAMYGCPLGTGDTDTLGSLQLLVHDFSDLPVLHEFSVLPANIWDSWFSTDKQQVDATQIAGVDAMTQLATALLTAVTEGAITVQEALNICVAFAAGKASGGGTTNIKYRDQADSKDRIDETVDASGNRTAVTVDGA